MDDLLICTKELAERLRVSTMTIHNLRLRGMPHIRVGNRIRFEIASVMLWLQTQQKSNYNGAIKKAAKNKAKQ